MENLNIDYSVAYLNFLGEESVCFRNRGKKNIIILSFKGCGVFYSNFLGEGIVYFRNRGKESVKISSFKGMDCIVLLQILVYTTRKFVTQLKINGRRVSRFSSYNFFIQGLNILGLFS